MTQNPDSLFNYLKNNFKETKNNKPIELVQRGLDISLAFFAATGHLLLLFVFNYLPRSLEEKLLYEWIQTGWIILAVIGYLGVVIGTLLKPGFLIKAEAKRAHWYLYFEAPGTILASVSTLVYTGALVISFGVVSDSVLAISYTLGIGIYFLLRFLRTKLLLKYS